MTTLENGYVLDGMNELERNTKRIFDFFIALFCIIVFSPLFLICWVAIKREDGGPAIFKQERIGRFGDHSTSISSAACAWMQKKTDRHYTNTRTRRA